MKKTLRGITIGFLIGTMSAGTVAYAKSAVENISVRYDNIKVYKDNVLSDLRDSNGQKIEPFIYNGTTYLPLRGAASLAGLDVTWDGATKSVYLWDEMTASDTYLMEVCPPYERDRAYPNFKNEGDTFNMSGQKYSNGLEISGSGAYALFNINGEYSNMEAVVGHVDGCNMEDATLLFYVDGRLVEEVDVPAEGLPKNVSIPLNYGLQLKIVGESDFYFQNGTGIGNITVH